jgi:hypothetical protein
LLFRSSEALASSIWLAAVPHYVPV